MKRVSSYIKEKKPLLFLFFIYLIAVCLIYGLYRLKWGPAFYTCLLTGAVTLIYIFVDFMRCLRKWRILETMGEGRRSYLDVQLLPKPDTHTEALYQVLLNDRERCLREKIEESRRQIGRDQEYYTRWSHQIKTPIAAMELLLQEEAVDERALARELLKTRQYVEMALSYQRLEGDGNDLVIQVYSLKDMVMQAVKKVSPLMIHKKISLDLHELLGEVLTDEKWLVFVLEQILTNAVKYTAEGGSVFMHCDGEQQLTIEDTGIGIRPEDLPRIFEWGYTGYNGRMDKRSTGIGLSLVKSAVDMLGHKIQITSRVGEGTRVVLNLRSNPLEVE